MSDPDAELGQPVIGVTAGEIDIDSRDELERLSLALAQQTRRFLDIVSRHLDPDIYDTDEFADAVKELALNRRRARIRLLVIDSRPLVTRGHRLTELAARLSSFIELRAPAVQHKEFNEAFVVADNEAYIYRQFSDRFEGQCDFSDRRRAATLGDIFDNMWERGVPDTRFRRLHL